MSAIDHFRHDVQDLLRDTRGVTDVAFTPGQDGTEKVSFWQDGIRAHFLLRPTEFADRNALAAAIGPIAQGAFAIAEQDARAERARIAKAAADRAKADAEAETLARQEAERAEQEAADAQQAAEETEAALEEATQ